MPKLSSEQCYDCIKRDGLFIHAIPTEYKQPSLSQRYGVTVFKKQYAKVDLSSGYVRFDGTDDYVRCKLQKPMPMAKDEKTIFFWARGRNTHNTDYWAALSTRCSSTGDAHSGYIIRCREQLGGMFEYSHTAYKATVITELALDRETWNNFAVTTGPDGTNVHLYVNGVHSMSGVAGSSNAETYNKTDLLIGAQHSSSYVAEGDMAHVAIWNKQLTDEEVQKVASSNPLCIQRDKLAVYYPMDDLSGNIARDLSGNGFNGELCSGAQFFKD